MWPCWVGKTYPLWSKTEDDAWTFLSSFSCQCRIHCPFPLSTPNVPCAFLQQILPTFLSHEAYGVTNLLQVKFILRDELKIVIQVPLKISVQLITKLKIVFCHWLCSMREEWGKLFKSKILNSPMSHIMNTSSFLKSEFSSAAVLFIS